MEKIIKLTNVSKKFGSKEIYRDLNLEIFENEIVGFVGENGIGKSVLFKIIAGLEKPNVGRVEVFGIKIGKDRDFAPNTGILVDSPGFIEYYDGFTNLKMLAEINDKISDNDIKSIMKKLGLDPENKTKLKNYSLGMKQRLCFAMVVAANTPVMLLDEVMNGLDQQNVQLISQVLLDLRSQNKLIIMASHLLQNLQQYADQVLFLKDGKIIEDFNNKEETERYLEFKSSSLLTDILNNVEVQTLPNKTSLIAIDNINQETFNQITNYLIKNNISFSVTKMSLENLFNKFYG